MRPQPTLIVLQSDPTKEDGGMAERKIAIFVSYSSGFSGEARVGNSTPGIAMPGNRLLKF